METITINQCGILIGVLLVIRAVAAAIYVCCSGPEKGGGSANV